MKTYDLNKQKAEIRTDPAPPGPTVLATLAPAASHQLTCATCRKHFPQVIQRTTLQDLSETCYNKRRNMTSAPTTPSTPEQVIGAQGRIKAAQAVLLAANVSYSTSPATSLVSKTVPATAIDPNATIRDANCLNHLIQSQTNYSLVLTSDATHRLFTSYHPFTLC